MHIVHHPGTSAVHASDHIQVSFWKPSAEELDRLITGGGVELHIKASADNYHVVSVATWPAIGPELIDGDPLMQRTTGYRCFGCCAKEGQPHTERCINLVSALQFARSKQAQDSSEHTEGLPLSYPPDLAVVLQSALAFMELRTGQMVEIFRAAGYEIVEQRTAEEAFILARIMRAVLTHGEKWAGVFAAQLRVAQDAAIEKHEASWPGTARDNGAGLSVMSA